MNSFNFHEIYLIIDSANPPKIYPGSSLIMSPSIWNSYFHFSLGFFPWIYLRILPITPPRNPTSFFFKLPDDSSKHFLDSSRISSEDFFYNYSKVFGIAFNNSHEFSKQCQISPRFQTSKIFPGKPPKISVRTYAEILPRISTPFLQE